MALIVCPDCGNSVSDRANACPRCGCPVALTKPQPMVRQGRPVQDAAIKFKVEGNDITYSEDEKNYLILHKPFERAAWEDLKIFKEYTKGAGKSYDILYSKKLWECFTGFDVVFENARDFLLGFGIDFIGVKAIQDRFFATFDMDKYMRDYVEGWEMVVQLVEEIKYKRGIQRGSRTKWTGGGFGIRGAITGAVKAGMLNLGTDAIRSIGDSFADSNDRAKVMRLKEDIVRSRKAYNSICETFYHSICEIGHVVYSICVETGITRPCNTWWTFEYYEGKLDNTMQLYLQGRCSKDDTIRNLCKCIEKYPMHIHSFLYIYQICPSAKSELLKVAEFQGEYGYILNSMNCLDGGRNWLKWKI